MSEELSDPDTREEAIMSEELRKRLAAREEAGYPPIASMSADELAQEAVQAFQHCDEDPCVCQDHIRDMFAARQPEASPERMFSDDEPWIKTMREKHERMLDDTQTTKQGELK